MFNLGLEAIQLNRVRTMYHSSSIKNLDSILNKGLIINSKSIYRGLLKPIIQGVYLSIDKRYNLWNVPSASNEKKVILMTCKIQYSNIYVDEDCITHILRAGIPSVFFNLELDYKKYTEKDNILVLLDIMDNSKSIEKVWNEFTNLVPGILRGLERNKHEILRDIYIGSICILARSNSNHIKKSTLIELGMNDYDISRILNLLTADTVKNYRSSLHKLVVNASTCIDSFIDISKKYDQQQVNTILSPRSFVSPKPIGYNKLPYISQIDVYTLNANCKTKSIENVYTKG